ncbi:hypothetical protein P7D50_09465 [Enterococcus dongliensis]|uniref:hypothetical protein n=1 Tax=Enterococcus dongliensis TaxID=2559925 RepID=UPI0028917C17|nr:hypothetical protein [Enterococcus dongliensis]MDT2648024.1 hypothetical protein [Enterococcus dongliensis]
MELLKLIKNHISSEWKKKFNDNVDILNRIILGQNQKIDVANKRIDNVVLHSGGDSPNEVVDARVNNKGETFDTLESRLLASEDKHDEDVTQLDMTQENQRLQFEQLNQAIGKLMGTYGATLDLYVSVDGDDKNGDGTEEKPFRTIQMAVNVMPLISSSQITIWIDDGVYLEDVVLKSINALRIDIRTIQSLSVLDESKNDMPVRVRSIGFFNCTGYFQIAGIQAVDQANAPVYGGRKYSFLCEQSGYLALNQVRCVENTKAISNHVAVYTGGSSKCHIYNSYFSNQNQLNLSILMSETRIAQDVLGTGNNIGFEASDGTVRDGSTSALTATTKQKTSGQGLIITKGTVL